ncbi:MAG: OadG family protein [Clostridia bacterium]|nr:OadG family protein [Clostridia bacterium]
MMKWFMTLAEATAVAAEATLAPSATPAPNALVDLPLFTKGLLTTGMGLLGVFLVLTLFFVTIKLMQKIGAKESSQN